MRRGCYGCLDFGHFAVIRITVSGSVERQVFYALDYGAVNI